MKSVSVPNYHGLGGIKMTLGHLNYSIALSRYNGWRFVSGSPEDTWLLQELIYGRMAT